MNTIKLGDMARDTITGFEGVVVAKTEWLHGCTRLTLQPNSLDKDGKIRETATFDQPQLELIRPKVHAVGSRETGGPRPEPRQMETPK